MSLVFALALIAVGYYLFQRHRNPNRQSIWADIKGSFRHRPEQEPPFEQPAHDRLTPKSVSSASVIARRDGHSLEADPGLTDSERLDEIMGLTDIWNRSTSTEPQKDGER